MGMTATPARLSWQPRYLQIPLDQRPEALRPRLAPGLPLTIQMDVNANLSPAATVCSQRHRADPHTYGRLHACS